MCGMTILAVLPAEGAGAYRNTRIKTNYICSSMVEVSASSAVWAIIILFYILCKTPFISNFINTMACII